MQGLTGGGQQPQMHQGGADHRRRQRRSTAPSTTILGYLPRPSKIFYRIEHRQRLPIRKTGRKQVDANLLARLAQQVVRAP